MLLRASLQAQVRLSLDLNPVTALLGPRQCGKTTLARTFVPYNSVNYFDLEDPEAVARLENPKLAFAQLEGIVVLDEIQFRPDLFPILRVLVDDPDCKIRFLILGSAQPSLLRQSAESLAGRIHFIQMMGFSLEELGPKAIERHWLQGAFPLAYLREPIDSFAWRVDYMKTFIHRDLVQFGHGIDGNVLTKLWAMLAHLHGQMLNSSQLAGSLGVSDATVRRYVELLTAYYLLRQLKPWHSNGPKREAKRPKMYIRDSGLLHCQLKLRQPDELLLHPAVGHSWEGYVIEQLCAMYPEWEPYFWNLHTGGEIDLILVRGQKKIGFEIKRADVPKLQRSVTESVDYLGLSHLYVIRPVGKRYAIADNISVWTFSDFIDGQYNLGET